MSVVDYEKATPVAVVNGFFGQPSRLPRSAGPKLSVSCTLATMTLPRPQCWKESRFFSLPVYNVRVERLIGFRIISISVFILQLLFSSIYRRAIMFSHLLILTLLFLAKVLVL